MTLLQIDSVSVSFGGLQALSGSDDRRSRGRGHRASSGPTAPARRRCSTSSPACSRPTRARCPRGPRHHHHEAAQAGPPRHRPDVPTAGDLRHACRSATTCWSPPRCAGAGRGTVQAGRPRRRAHRAGRASRRWPSERVDKLSTGTQRLVELARALATKPQVLLLDEPSSGLTRTRPSSSPSCSTSSPPTGLGILLVEHDMSLVMSACDHIHVLDFGRLIAFGTPKRYRRTRSCGPRTWERATRRTCPRSRRACSRRLRARGGGCRPSGRRRPTARPAPHRTGPTASRPPLDSRSRRRGPARRPAPRSSCSTSVPRTAPSTCCTASSISIPPGQVFALLGPNGAGKSTTLKVASGQLAPVRRRGAFLRRRASTVGPRTAWPAPGCARSPKAGASSRTSPCSRTSA